MLRADRQTDEQRERERERERESERDRWMERDTKKYLSLSLSPAACNSSISVISSIDGKLDRELRLAAAFSML